jgi:hypothetical protein
MLSLSRETETFLRFLAAPRAFQRTYVRMGDRLYGYEGRESCIEVEDGLPLLLAVGEDNLARDRQKLQGRSGDNELVEVLFHIESIVRFVVESGSEMIAILDMNNEDEIMYYPSGIWRVLGSLSKGSIQKLGIENSLPDSYEEVFLSQCVPISEA